MLRKLFISAAAIAALVLTACQTSMVRSFEKVQNGMDKHQVLETLGDPSTTTRLHGKDRWIYRFYDDGVAQEKEVHFTNGAVSYVGAPWNPPVERQAVTVDAQNAEKEAAIQAEEKARDEARKNVNISLEQMEREARGTDKVKYMPTFVDLQ